MGILGDTPGVSAGRKVGLASSGREGPQPTLTPQTQSIALPDTVPGLVPPELSTNVSFGCVPVHRTKPTLHAQHCAMSCVSPAQRRLYPYTERKSPVLKG